MEKDLKCLRCGWTMEFLMRENIQLGKTGWILGDLGNLMAGALDVTVLRCPACGVRYDFDCPKCPACGAANPKF